MREIRATIIEGGDTMLAAPAEERGPAGREGQKTMLWVVLPAVLVGTILQRISGTGVGLVVAPAFAISLGGSNGVFLTNVTTAVSGFLLTCALWRTVNWSQWAKLCSSALIGTVIGAVVVRVTPGSVLQLVVGSVVLLGMVVLLSGGGARQPADPERSSAGTTTYGAAGGLLNVTAGVAAPAMVIYSRVTGWRQTEYAATMQPVFMTLGVTSLAAKFAMGAVEHATMPTPWLFVGVAGMVLLGLAAGTPLARRIPASTARTMALVLAGAGAVVAILKGLFGLLG
ncbi:sulfite exporter TauE/SafE family protein [Rothia sp. HC945]|uniref:TSUP family transporter n=1 Tax=Rothia sp. HC945 TaxID=3171170 RepID=UPI003F255864